MSGFYTAKYDFKMLTHDEQMRLSECLRDISDLIAEKIEAATGGKGAPYILHIITNGAGLYAGNITPEDAVREALEREKTGYIDGPLPRFVQ